MEMLGYHSRSIPGVDTHIESWEEGPKVERRSSQKKVGSSLGRTVYENGRRQEKVYGKKGNEFLNSLHSIVNQSIHRFSVSDFNQPFRVPKYRHFNISSCRGTQKLCDTQRAIVSLERECDFLME